MDLAPMPCPSCDGQLEAERGRHGVVWICRNCRSGAATLPLLRQVAPRSFVNHLWQAAQSDGRASRNTCPSCTQPFTTFSGSGARVEPSMEVCVRCYWVWLSPASVTALADLRGARPALPAPDREDDRAQLCRLAGEAILSVLR